MRNSPEERFYKLTSSDQKNKKLYLYERVDALRYHFSFVIRDHQWRAGLPWCWAKLSLYLRGADSSGRVVRVGRIVQRLSSKVMSFRVLAFCNNHGVVPLLEKFPVDLLILVSIGLYIIQWGRFGPAWVDSCGKMVVVLRGQAGWVNVVGPGLGFKVSVLNLDDGKIIRYKLAV